MGKRELESDGVKEEIKEYRDITNSHGVALPIMDGTTSGALNQSR